MMNKALTMDEYNNKLAYVNNSIYNAIESKFVDALGERIAKKSLQSILKKAFGN